MYAVEHPGELHRIADDAVRTWIETRMTAVRQDDVPVCFWVVEPQDDVLTACGTACWGAAAATATIEDLMIAVEDVEVDDACVALVVPCHHEAALILVIPASARLDDTLRAALRSASGVAGGR